MKLIILAVFLVAITVQTVYSQPMEGQKQVITNITSEMMRHLDRMKLIDSTCNLRVNQGGDLGLLPDCLKVMEAFNAHMRQMINETKPRIDSILLG